MIRPVCVCSAHITMSTLMFCFFCVCVASLWAVGATILCQIKVFSQMVKVEVKGRIQMFEILWDDWDAHPLKRFKPPSFLFGRLSDKNPQTLLSHPVAAISDYLSDKPKVCFPQHQQHLLNEPRQPADSTKQLSLVIEMVSWRSFLSLFQHIQQDGGCGTVS